jgi:hypothetical protein
MRMLRKQKGEKFDVGRVLPMKNSSTKSFYERLDKFIKALYADGTVGRWERRREIEAAERNRRGLNRKIREEKVIRECLKDRV